MVFSRIWKSTDKKNEWVLPSPIYQGFCGRVALHLLRSLGVFSLFLLRRAYFIPRLRLELGMHRRDLEPLGSGPPSSH